MDFVSHAFNRSQGQQIIAQIFHSNIVMTVLSMALSFILSAFI